MPVKALVTGAAGFVGRHMAWELRYCGWTVDAVDIAGGHDALEVFRSSAEVYDLVVHAAARSPHRAAIDGQPSIMAYNLMLDAAMFDWAVRTGQRRVLYLSSSAVYPVDCQNDFATAKVLRERMVRFDRYNIGRPDASYGWTKLTGERMAVAAAEAGLAVHVVRPFSGYGEDQGVDWPFGAFIDRACRRADPFPIWGDGHQVRDWIHIDDVVAGALAVVDADVREPVNLCTGRGVSMLELVSMVCTEAGYRPAVELQPGAPTGVAYRVGDPATLQAVYTPRVSIDEGVKRALAGGTP